MTLTYVHNDHLGTPMAMTDEHGTVVWRATKKPFGETTVDEDPDGDGQTVTLNIRFPGQYYDAETGMHYNWHREYEPGIGRYVESDPIGLLSRIDPYVYADGTPVNANDFLGLFGSKKCGYYKQACNTNGGFFECHMVERACNSFPKGNDTSDCIRQCLQERHKKHQPTDV